MIKDIFKSILKDFILFFIGGLMYVGIECLFRGHSHWTMFILGGLCFGFIGSINEKFSWNLALTSQMMISSIIITGMEFLFGIILNRIFLLDVWDYSDMPYNIDGQICLIFSVAWFFLSLIGIIVDDYIRYFLFKEEKPHYKIL